MGLAWYSGLDRYVPSFRVWFLRDSWPYGVVFVVQSLDRVALLYQLTFKYVSTQLEEKQIIC